jgi:hypothetical protein
MGTKIFWRWAIRVTAILVILVMGTALGLALTGRRALEKARHDFRKNAGPIDFSAYRSKATPQELLAGKYLTAGCSAVVTLQGDRINGLVDPSQTPSLDPSQLARMKDFVERNGPAMQLFDRARGLGPAAFPASSLDLRFADNDAAFSTAKGIRLLAVSARLDTLTGKAENVAPALVSLAQLSSALENQPNELSLIFGNWAERLYWNLSLEAFQVHPNPDLAKRYVRMGPDGDLDAIWRRARAGSVVRTLVSVAGGSAPEKGGILTRWSLGDWREAAWLEWNTDLIRKAVVPFGPEPVTLKGFPWGWPVIFAKISSSGWSRLGRSCATLALRQMARTALTLEGEAAGGGGYPPKLPSAFCVPDPFTGKPPVYSLGSDGSASLSLPLAAEKYARLTSPKPTKVPRFEIHLPPPASLHAAENERHKKG